MSSPESIPQPGASPPPTSVFLPWIPTVAAAANSSVAVLVHQSTGLVTIVEGYLDVELLLRELPSPKEGASPASRASIESLPMVRESDPDLECSICLAGYGDEEAKEMPCGHRFHSACIDKWLGIRGSCPLCRHGLAPVVDDVRGGWMIHVLLSGSDQDTGMGDDGHVHWDDGD